MDSIRSSAAARTLSLFFLLSLAVLAGCSRRADALDRRDERDPWLRRARARRKANDDKGAIRLYQQALQRTPDLARAHLELGLLYEETEEDYIRAVYHYQRYLELRPDTEKRELIQEVIRRARLAFAASLPETPPGAVSEIARLRRENETLRARLAALHEERQAVESAASSPAPEAAPAAAVLPDPPPPADAEEDPVRTYRVRRGDTLSSIAASVYNDPQRWADIFEANRSQLPRPETVREGQVLIIPE